MNLKEPFEAETFLPCPYETFVALLLKAIWLVSILCEAAALWDITKAVLVRY